MHAPPVPWRLAGPVLALGLLASGCGKEVSPEPVEIKGHVKYANGRPVCSVVLLFHPQEERNQRNMPSVTTGYRDGAFVCRCLPGRYKVTVSLPTTVRGDPLQGGAEGQMAPAVMPLPGAPITLPTNYQSARSTPWEVEIGAEGKDRISLVLK